MSIVLGVSGHRYLGNIYTTRQQVDINVKRLNTDVIISGMAEGFNLLVAEYAVEEDIPLWAVIPWRGHSVNDKATYNRIKKAANRITYISDGDSFPGKQIYHECNLFIVDNCTHMMIYLDSRQEGGTWDCYNAAKGKKPVRNIYYDAPY